MRGGGLWIGRFRERSAEGEFRRVQMWGEVVWTGGGWTASRRLRVGSAQEFILPSLASEYVRVLVEESGAVA